MHVPVYPEPQPYIRLHSVQMHPETPHSQSHILPEPQKGGTSKQQSSQSVYNILFPVQRKNTLQNLLPPVPDSVPYCSFFLPVPQALQNQLLPVRWTNPAVRNTLLAVPVHLPVLLDIVGQHSFCIAPQFRTPPVELHLPRSTSSSLHNLYMYLIFLHWNNNCLHIHWHHPVSQIHREHIRIPHRDPDAVWLSFFPPVPPDLQYIDIKYSVPDSLHFSEEMHFQILFHQSDASMFPRKYLPQILSDTHCFPVFLPT